MGISTDNFIADTVNLTNEEIGIYFRLLCYAWKNEAYLPKDISRIKRIVQNANEEDINYILETYFKEDDNGYFSKAQKEEFEWVIEKSGKAKEAADKRWSNANAPQTHMRTQSSYSHSHSYNKIINDVFEDIWSKLKTKRGTKSEGLKAYKKIHGKVEPNLLIEKYNAKSDSLDEKKFLAHFSRWLNSEGWTEELLSEKKEEFKIDNRNPYANLPLWKKGIRTMNDTDQDIRKAYNDGLLEKNHLERLSISV
tara:strand:+ start:907 stop:1662 length:756 start_codon:yes stop_codon:yes gene_type:complete